MNFTIIEPTPKYVEQFVISGIISVDFEKELEFSFVIPKDNIEQVLIDIQKIYFGLNQNTIDLYEDILLFNHYLKPFLSSNNILEQERFFVKKYPDVSYYNINGVRCEIEVSLDTEETYEIDNFKNKISSRINL